MISDFISACLLPSGSLAGMCIKPKNPELPFDTRMRSFSSALGSPLYFFETSIQAGPTTRSSIAWHATVLCNRYGHETRILHDAGKAEIVGAFNRIAEEAQPADSGLLFYAGHGYLMDDTKMGFWIPVDASVRSAANWLSNSDITKLLKAIPYRQVILISDSYFSGSLTREQKITGAATPKTSDILNKRSVLAFSSGGEEPVSDEGLDGHSIFAWHLINTMKATIEGTSLGFDVYRTVHNCVQKNYPQEPQYGAVYSAGHMSGGDYLFSTE